jgi:ribonucleoside-diphosphate reductase alpha chain
MEAKKEFKLPSTNLDLTENALFVLAKRYLKKTENGAPSETPEDMFMRVAKAIAAADLNYDPHADIEAISKEFYDMMTLLDFLPNSPTLMNAGRELGQLSACFVLPIEDDIEGIFDSVKYAALIHKSGGGTGFSFSKLRPDGDIVLSTHGVASGPISFMNVFDAVTETIKQGGTRRGANMGILRVDHPDIEAFITSKLNHKKLTNFNISVALTEDFMKSVEADIEYPLINPRTKKTTSLASAREIFDKIIDCAWRSGEPGIVFLDRINRSNPTPQLGEIESTNPCGEQPLLPYESCNLGSINLGKFYNNGKIDYDRLSKIVAKAVHFLDNVIDINKYPLAEIKKNTLVTRKIGLGVMGLADLLIQLKIPYNSKKAIIISKELMSFIDKESKKASARLAEKRGNFIAYNGSIYDTPETPYMRNATTTTIAPTGSISIIANASSGIEPIFAICYIRKILDGTEMTEAHPLFIRLLKERGIYTDDLLKEVAKRCGIKDIHLIPDDVKEIFVTAMDITPQDHIEIQAAFQENTDNAVSKTINFPQEATPDDIRDAYMLAWKRGLKGITIYRYGSRDEQVLNLHLKDKIKEEKEIKGEAGMITPRPRPSRTRGVTDKLRTGCGNLYVTINQDTEGICEVFAQMGKAGGCAACQIEAASRLVSLALRSGINIRSIVEQLSGIRCPSPSWSEGKQILSCPDAMAKVLSTVADIEIKKEHFAGMTCPECGATLEQEGGCILCRSCGYSKCD